MPSNVLLNDGTGTVKAVTIQVTHDGDTAQLQGMFLMGASGTEDLYTVAQINGDATNGLDVDVTRVSGTVTVDGTGGSFPVTDSGGSLTVDGTVAATQSGAWTVLPGNTANTTAWLVTGTGGSFPVTDSAGSLTVDAPVGTPVFVRLSDGAAAITTLPVSLATVPSHAVTNAGTFAVQVDGSALTALQLIDNSIVADDAAFTPATTSVNVAGFFADEASTDSVDEGDAGAARMTLDRKQIITPYAHAAAGGATPYKNLDVDETEDEVKATAGKVFWLHAINLAATKRYLKFYNLTAANTTVGTSTPVLTFPIPTMADTNGAGFTINFGDMGVQFDTAITVAATTGFADNDSAAPGANEIIVNLGYL